MTHLQKLKELAKNLREGVIKLQGIELTDADEIHAFQNDFETVVSGYDALENIINLLNKQISAKSDLPTQVNIETDQTLFDLNEAYDADMQNFITDVALNLEVRYDQTPKDFKIALHDYRVVAYDIVW
jgi:hypothetical protein